MSEDQNQQGGDAAKTQTPPNIGFTGFKQDAQKPDAQAAGKAPPPEPGSAPPRTIDFGGEKLDVPENFWDAENNTVNVGALLKSQADLRKQLGERPSAPENYEVKLPEDLAKELGESWQIPADDPHLAELTAIAKEGSLPQAGYSKLLGLYARAKLAEVKAADEKEAVDMAQEWADLEARFGGADQAKRVHGELNAWLKAVLPDDKGAIDQDTANVANYLLNTGPGVKVLARLRDRMGGKSGLPLPGGGSASASVGEDDLRARSADPRNIPGPKFDPAFRAETDHLYKSFYDKK